MSDMVTVKGKVENGNLIVELPPDAPDGEVEVVVRKVVAYTPPQLTPEEEAVLDAEFEALMNDPKTFTGLGLTADEIAKSSAIGIWKDRADMEDPVEYLAEMRRKRKQKRLQGED